MKSKLFIFPLLVVFIAIFSACEEIPTKFETEENLISIADFLFENETDYSSFIEIMKASSMEDALSSHNPNGENYTLFLPHNTAVENYINSNPAYNDLAGLLDDQDFIRAIARYHVVNKQIASNDFPLGALSDSSLTGDYLIIAFIQDTDSIYFKVNNQALVEKRDLKMSNGFIHVIDHVLEPITMSGYDWVRENPDYKIIADLFELTDLVDTMGLYVTDKNGRVIENYYSLLIEADSIFQKEGIMSLDDLLDKYGEGRTDFTNEQNPIYQFAAYHILTESRFLADLYEGTNNYNTYSSLPVQITAEIDIKVNEGVTYFDSVFSETDSIYYYINYLEIYVNESNIQTRNGPVHFINHVMELYQPERTQRTFEFYEEPSINRIRTEEREAIFTDEEEFSVISWSGVEELIWKKSSNSSEKANNKDFIEVDGDFLITYDIPKILAGKYGLQMRIDNDNSDNATIQVFLDGKQVGSNMNLTTGGQNNSNPYRVINLGIVEFGKYEEHTIAVRSLIPGRFIWDWVRFESDLEAYE